MYLLEIFRDRIHKTEVTRRATCQFIVEILLDLEAEFTVYLKSRKCRWIGMRSYNLDKKNREILRKEVQENINEGKVAGFLVMLN